MDSGDLNIKKVFSGAALGMFVGGIATLLKQVASMHMNPDKRLDPPAPNMEELAPNLADAFRSFMGPFFKMCSDENKVKYQETVKEAIQLAEMVMVIQTQLRNGEVAPIWRHRTEASAYANLCVKKLRSLRIYFDSQILYQINETIDFIDVNIADQLGNIRNMTEL